MKRSRISALFGLVVAIALLLAAAGGPVFAGGGNPDMPRGLERAIQVQEKHTERLLGLEGVVGTAVGLGADGNPAVLVLAEKPGLGGIPAALDGVQVEVVITGKIVALKPPAGAGKPPKQAIDPKARFPRPVPIGVSTGNAGECSAGTIGARVKDADGNVYALSNNHVYALENKALIGSKVLQPGLYDTGCVYDSNNVIGALSDFVAIDFSGDANTVDAAIALSSIANLGNATPSNGYGTPKSTTVAASLGQAVQKYGRTTGLTKGTVTGINATVSVGYSSGTALFKNQIIVQSRKPFIKAGDSGSLLVADPGRESVGLLFAGDATGNYGVANPIDAVLAALGVTIDGE